MGRVAGEWLAHLTWLLHLDFRKFTTIQFPFTTAAAIMPGMDIALDQSIDYEKLRNFLDSWWPESPPFLLYDGRNEWEDVSQDQTVIQFLVNAEQPGPFKYGLAVFTSQPDPLPVIERLAQAVSQTFQCRTLCDAARVVLKENKTFYALLFEAGQVYLVNDFDFEAHGTVTPIVALHYALPGGEGQ